MREPRVISTLAEAAKWMTEATATEWTSESLLDFIYREMEKALDEEYAKIDDGIGVEGLDEACTQAEMRARVHDAYCLDISLPPTTRIVHRYWNTETVKVEIIEHERGLAPLLPLLDTRHVLALLEHGAIELPNPLSSEPWNDDEGYCIDADTAPIITSESLRISESRLRILADIFNEQNKQEALLTSIDDLDLTFRSKNALINEKILWIEELVMRSGNDLLKFSTLGRKSLNEIREKLALRGLKLRDEF